MVNKHFFKVLIIFCGMIILGLVGVLLVSNFEEGSNILNSAGIAK